MSSLYCYCICPYIALKWQTAGIKKNEKRMVLPHLGKAILIREQGGKRGNSEQVYENQASGIAPTDGCDFSITVDGMKNMGL